MLSVLPACLGGQRHTSCFLQPDLVLPSLRNMAGRGGSRSGSGPAGRDLRLLGEWIRAGTVAGTRGWWAVVPDAVRRWLYRRRRASGLARFLNAAQAQLAAVGIGPRWLVTVEVTGRRTGRTISFPAVIADYDNGR